MNNRQKISELIIGVLTEKMTVQEAIKDFPKFVEDESEQCALHALLHYEADEEFRRHDPEYASEQDDHLESIANAFKNGESLPINIILEYKNYYEETPLLSKYGLKTLFKRLFRITL